MDLERYGRCISERQMENVDLLAPFHVFLISHFLTTTRAWGSQEDGSDPGLLGRASTTIRVTTTTPSLPPHSTHIDSLRLSATLLPYPFSLFRFACFFGVSMTSERVWVVFGVYPFRPRASADVSFALRSSGWRLAVPARAQIIFLSSFFLSFFRSLIVAFDSDS
ncbi:hypothetical protein BDN70DRAFT_624347 [Pholiota conissans]|uniref:Uncharacterized protein n=1 Tax=Pholiota conissans TaxID=109636 RepID=A0A9P5Z3M7_9AGAR|nr:hypothetical protein BDN70DRAFT_624347 [Pholiota conissans]